MWHAPEPVYFFVSDPVCMSGTVYAYKYVRKCVCVCVRVCVCECVRACGLLTTWYTFLFVVCY